MTGQAPEGWAERGARRAGRTAGRFWRLLGSGLPDDPLGITAVLSLLLILVLPFAVLTAFLADLIALLLGGVIRCTLTFAALGASLAIALALAVGGAEGGGMLMAAALAACGAGFAGLIVGFLAGPIFRKLPESMDRDAERAE